MRQHTYSYINATQTCYRSSLVCLSQNHYQFVGVKTFYDEAKAVPPFFVAACEIGGFLPIIGTCLLHHGQHLVIIIFLL